MSTEADKLSLKSAVFININIMIGIGLFVNTTVLAQSLGSFGWAAYAALAALLLPLIFSIAKLVEIYPSGGFYIYAASALHPFAGFVSAWCYFTAKLASATLMIHASMQLLQQIIPLLAHISIFALDITIMSVFVGLNMFHMRTGKAMQTAFLCMKLIPIFFVLLTGFFLFSTDNLNTSAFNPAQFINAMPLVLFAALGFEATTALSSNIENAKQNGPRAILISYAVVVLLNMLYQFFFYNVVGSNLGQAVGFLQAFPLLISRCCGFSSAGPFIQNICNIAIASSALGGAFGIIYSNSRNLYTLALHKHIVNFGAFLKENRFGIPFGCVLAEGALFLIYLICTHAQQVPLQQIAAFGMTIAYSLSVLALLITVIRDRSSNVSPIIPALGLVNCLFFLASCLKSFHTHGAQSLYLYCSFLCFGVCMYLISHYKRLANLKCN